jgi:hypothetical protein
MLFDVHAYKVCWRCFVMEAMSVVFSSVFAMLSMYSTRSTRTRTVEAYAIIKKTQIMYHSFEASRHHEP